MSRGANCGPDWPSRASASLAQASFHTAWVISVDLGMTIDVRSAGIFGHAPRHSQAVVEPLESVFLRYLGAIRPVADHAGGTTISGQDGN